MGQSIYDVKYRLSLDGIQKLQRSIAAPVFGPIMDIQAENLADMVRQEAPVKTGALRDSVTVTPGHKANPTVAVTVPYAGFVEFGTSRNYANDFFHRAVARFRIEFATDMRDISVALLAQGVIPDYLHLRYRRDIRGKIPTGSPL